MTDLAIRPTNEVSQYRDDPTGGRLVAWAEAAVAAHNLATSLCRTTFVPAHFKDNTGNATAAIIAGDELGMSPLASLRAFYVVHGTPALYAKSMVALALSHGHSIWTEKSTDAEVVVCGQRKGSDHVERSTWTTARARTAGYTSNKKYQTNPQEMLYAKAASEIARKIAADVLAGIPLSVEDLELEAPAATVTMSRDTTAPPKRAQRKPVTAPVVPEPEFDDAPSADPEPAADDEPTDVTGAEELITDQQMKKVQILFKEKGFKDSADRHDYVATLGFEVAASSELTKAQAHAVIESLLALEDAS